MSGWDKRVLNDTTRQIKSRVGYGYTTSIRVGYWDKHDVHVSQAEVVNCFRKRMEKEPDWLVHRINALNRFGNISENVFSIEISYYYVQDRYNTVVSFPDIVYKTTDSEIIETYEHAKFLKEI